MPLAGLCRRRGPAAAGEGRQAAVGGKYAEAAEIYEPRAAKDPAAALGLALRLEANGKTDKAVRALQALAEKRPELQAELARLAFERGDLKEAAARGRRGLALGRPAVAGPLDRGPSWTAPAGRLDEAERGYHWLVELLQRSRREAGRIAALDRPGRRPICPLEPPLRPVPFPGQRVVSRRLEARSGLLAGALRGGDAVPGEVQRGRRRQGVQGRLGAESAGGRGPCGPGRAGPGEPQRRGGRGVAATGRWRSIRRLLPRLADRGRSGLGRSRRAASLALVARKGPAAQPDRRRDARPHGRLLRADGARGTVTAESLPATLDRLLAEVTRAESPRRRILLRRWPRCWRSATSRPRPSDFSARRFASCPGRSARRPTWGCSTCAMGREEEARKLLEEAFEADPFNVRVKNKLEVLGRARRDADVEHRALRAEVRRPGRQVAGPLRRPAHGDGLSRVVQVVRLPAARAGRWWRFSTRPRGWTGINGSARMIGLPYLDTVAACTGGMRGHGLAQRAAVGAAIQLGPGAAARAGPRHHAAADEVQHSALVHRGAGRLVRGLSAAADLERAARWIACRGASSSTCRRSTSASPGPCSGEDWQMAYCQAELYVEYMLTRGGEDRCGRCWRRTPTT